MSLKFISATFFLTCILCTSESVAQTPISADRPGFGYGSYIVPKGTLFIESGATSGEFGLNFGELILRTGLHKRIEVQLKLGSLTHRRYEGWEIGTQYINFKIELFKTENNKFRTALLNSTHLAFLDDEYDDYFNRFYVIAEYDLTNWLSLNGNMGFGNYIFSEIELPERYYSLNLSIRINPETTIYGGYFYGKNEYYDESVMEFGVAYLIKTTFQFDAGFMIDDEHTPYMKMGIAISLF